MIVVVKKCEHLELLLIGIIGGGRGGELFAVLIFQKTMRTSKNMKSKVPILGMKLSPYLLQHVTTGLVVHSVVIVSNETIHKWNIAFSCNMKLLDYLKSINPRLKMVYFWSDGVQASLNWSMCSDCYPFTLPGWKSLGTIERLIISRSTWWHWWDS